MKIQLKVNIIHTSKLPLSVVELENFDKYIGEKLNQFFSDKTEDWTHAFWENIKTEMPTLEKELQVV